MKTKFRYPILLSFSWMILVNPSVNGAGPSGLGSASGPAAATWGPPRLSLRLTAAAGSTSALPYLRLQGPPFVPYVIQVSPDLNLWRSLVTNLTGGDGQLNYTDPQTDAVQRRYYRALLARHPNGWGGISLDADGFRPDRILVKPRTGVDLAAVNLLLSTQVLQSFPAVGNLQVLQVPPGQTAQQLIAAYQQSGSVQYAEPDYAVGLLVSPNDPRYADGTLWALHNAGQFGGHSSADIDAPDGWDTQHDAGNIIVAIIDTGVRYTHEDLAANIWTNPGATNHGINAITGTDDPWDDFGHGTHLAGVIGAVGNNHLGVVGVAWSVQLLACKFIDSQGNGTISGAIACIDYARGHGAKVINASWGAATFKSSALHDAIASARDAGIIFVAAAGNSQGDNDGTNAIYPASYTDLDNVVSVAATTRQDELAAFSNYGARRVHLGAPGEDIYSTYDQDDHSYVAMSGTSMAAAYVSGVCAVVWAHYPDENYRQIIQRVLSGTDPLPALAGKTITGGRLNLLKALSDPAPAPPVADFSAAPSSGNAPLTVQFSDKSTGAITAWDWNFGDNSADSSSQNPTHTYAGGGSFKVTLTVTGGEGITNSKSAIIQVSASSPSSPVPPEAIFGAYPLTGLAPLPVQFFDRSTGAIVTWDWDFGDGSPHSNLENPSHTYQAGGSFTVSLTVSDKSGATGSMSGTLQVIAPPSLPSPTPPPRASFAASPTSGQAPLTVQFTDQSVGTVTAWDWHFGDGSPDSSSQNPTHTYADPGSYTVTLTVSGAGTNSSSNAVIQVDNPQPPPVACARPNVTVSATVATASALGTPGTFTIQLSCSAPAPITVLYSMGGNARNGADYQTLSGSVTIPAGATAADVVVQPIPNPAMTLDQSVYLMLYGYTGAPYVVVKPDAAAITIKGGPPPSPRPDVTVVASGPTASVLGAPGTFTIQLSSSASVPITVLYSLGGNARNGVDYQNLSGKVTIPAGALSANVVVQPIVNPAMTLDQPVYLMLYGYKTAPYCVDKPDAAAVTILGNH
ncbi:MAG: S8 family serine peptidase [Verrucomicrobia bacterium]|nr:S8 family serine peptidase [Verrucomicrobiota bacterium]